MNITLFQVSWTDGFTTQDFSAIAVNLLSLLPSLVISHPNSFAGTPFIFLINIEGDLPKKDHSRNHNLSFLDALWPDILVPIGVILTAMDISPDHQS